MGQMDWVCEALLTARDVISYGKVHAVLVTHPYASWYLSYFLPHPSQDYGRFTKYRHSRFYYFQDTTNYRLIFGQKMTKALL